MLAQPRNICVHFHEDLQTNTMLNEITLMQNLYLGQVAILNLLNNFGRGLHKEHLYEIIYKSNHTVKNRR